MRRYIFLSATLRQTLAALSDALESALHFFVGVTKRILADNMTTAVA